jgi:hypothetical protein
MRKLALVLELIIVELVFMYGGLIAGLLVLATVASASAESVVYLMFAPIDTQGVIALDRPLKTWKQVDTFSSVLACKRAGTAGTGCTELGDRRSSADEARVGQGSWRRIRRRDRGVGYDRAGPMHRQQRPEARAMIHLDLILERGKP